MTRRSVPGIPAPTDANLRDVARALKSILDVREGLIGDPLDRFITLRELKEAGLVNTQTNRAAGDGATTVVPIPSNPVVDEDNYDPTTDYTTPPRPEDFTVIGLFAAIKLTWGLPRMLNYAYTEIWAASTNSLAEASLIGTTSSQLFLDYLGQNQSRYYWIRFVSEANVIGPYNSDAGTLGQTALSPDLLLESLTGQITESELYTDLGARIDLIDAPDTGLVTQVTNVRGKYTVKIDSAGHVSGYGLISEPNDGNPVSAFGIRADQFWIAPPAINSNTAPTTNNYKGKVWVDTSGAKPVTKYFNGTTWVTTPSALPFVVQTSPTTVGRVNVPPGVYIDSAYIKNASITAAQIGSVDADTINAGYTSSVDLESSTFYGSHLYIGGTATYKKDPNDSNRKIGILSVTNPSVAINNSGAEFTVDFFRIKTSPVEGAQPVFEAVNGAVRIRTALIATGSITNAYIGNFIQSNNYQTGVSGWRIDKTGDAELNNATFRGTLDVVGRGNQSARMEIKNDAIRVYDESGALRVQLGKLS